MQKKFQKSAVNKKFFGVCGGLSEYFGIDASIIRLIWALFVILGGTGVLAYLIFALVMPKAD